MVEPLQRESRSSSRQPRANQNLNSLPSVDEVNAVTNQIREDLQNTSEATTTSGATSTTHQDAPDLQMESLDATSSAQVELQALQQTDVRTLNRQQLSEFTSRISMLKQVLELTSVLPNRSASKRRRSSSGERTARERDPILDLVKQSTPKLKDRTLQSLKQWTNDVEVVFKMLSVDKSSYSRLALWATRGLEGEVSRRCASKSEELGEALTWSAISEVVRDYVSDPAVRQATNSVAFYNCSWTPGQSLDNFKNYLETLESNLNHTLRSDSRLWFTFAKLPETIRARMIELDEPRTFTNARSLWDRAMRLESIAKPDGSRGRSARVPSTFRRSADAGKAEGESSTSSQGKTDDTPQQSGGSDARRSSRGGNQYRGRAFRAPRTERPTTDETGERTCFSCGKSGHISRLCPEASRKNSESSKNENT